MSNFTIIAAYIAKNLHLFNFVLYCMRDAILFRGCASFKNRATNNSKNNSKFIIYTEMRLFILDTSAD